MTATVQNTNTKLTSSDSFNKSDYDFVGWCLNADCSQPKKPFADQDFVTNVLGFADDDNVVTLYAKWKYVCTSGKWLRVGKDKNDRICLDKNKPNGRAFGVMINGQPYYARLSSDTDVKMHENSSKKLRTKVGNNIYNLYDTSVQAE